MEKTPPDRKAILAKMVAYRSFLRMAGVLTDSMNDAIHKKIVVYQDKYKINITQAVIDKAVKKAYE